MKKTLIITVMVDGVELSELEEIQGKLDEVFDYWPDKRITVQIQDEPLVKRPK